ncbi:MAG TPA: dihydropteroate synthase [Anaerohalosphaeraceae bacterium]|nr:dihydropteroate synthase [Anaerohalosphaeraceae bacterium]
MESLPQVVVWPAGRLDFSAGPLVMGILNVTPDSFSDGGDFFEPDKAVAAGVQMAQQGAAILDVGAESTRPGSRPVPADEQIRRAVPVIEALARGVSIPISIDTRDPDVAQAAVRAGASILNDITALADERMARLAADRQLPVVLMHMQGTPETMQQKPHYDDVVAEVKEYLLSRAAYAESVGIRRERIFLDPGIGFGKTTEHNLLLLGHLEEFVGLGYRVLVGVSRKRFIGQLTGRENPKERLFGTAAAVALAAAKGASILRVHDVGPMADVVRVAYAVAAAESSV